MSYLVLARKWRPQTFSDLTGQEHVSQTLQNAIDSGRIAHAFLFTGARGVGKTSSARILAKALTCEQGMSPEPCNVCPACTEITAGTAVDVLEIDGASNTGVDDIRELRENVKYLPSRLRYKIFIIDEVHMLSTNAFNALLKTLEEPPPHVKFIFATTEPHKVPITILSRCQRFDFRRIPLGKVVGRLRHIVDQEGIAISDASLTMVARKGDGSMRDSLSVLDQVLAFCGDQVRDEEVVSLLGVVDRRLLLDATAAVFGRDTRTVLDIVARVDEFGYNMRQFCGELIDHLRNLLILKAVGDGTDLLDLSEAELATLRQQAESVPLDDLQRHLTVLLRADGELGHTSFPRLVLEMALVKMATLAPAVPVDQLLERLNRIEEEGGGVADARVQWRPTPPAPAGSRAPERTAATPPPRTAERQAAPSAPAPRREEAKPASEPRRTGDSWADFVALVKGRKPRLGSMLEQGSPLVVTAERLEIGFPEGAFALASLRDSDSQAALKELARQFFSAEPVLVMRPLAPGAAEAPPNLLEKKRVEKEQQQTVLKQAATSHPAVADALDVFGGTLAEVEPLEGKEPR
ncbi:DNA polymerase III subunit gamma/tau [Geobacter hydrogenophilus]|uniref:DNA polymerase III subunit gamma/tau n=1 Tax=Geobacter hydrogenophilus TaxID=40983 RepID=A0A9W6FZW2_9BACT|nr:DNA polymerase III subunit gamma/tau [Geobacter hydrogenophilus]MBT0893389.1 DNA polymerase III subunit gamma/tau [Geobacter hydrogenophilus]GLI37916.1 DNA polymerase III subunit gamma/tau [Geobacter hydrogenophilus]